jgi:hypothetical protein
MNLEELWNEALNNTRIVRSRIAKLPTFTHAELPYIFLAESEVNIGNTVVRKGKVIVDKPLIFLPNNSPQFSGFEFEKNLKVATETIKTFLLLRGINFPSLKYTHFSELEIFEGQLETAIKEYNDILAKEENIDTGLIVGLTTSWQFSILIYVANLIINSANENIEQFIMKFKDINKNQ